MADKTKAFEKGEKKGGSPAPATSQKARADVREAAGNLAIQRFAASETGSDTPRPGPAARAALNRPSGGVVLPFSARSRMESAFGVGLDHARIHTDTLASQAAQELNADAFTYGSNIYFGAGKYQPDTPSGQQLLAHELVHTIQQGAVHAPILAASPATDAVTRPNDRLEREADAVARQVVAGQETDHLLLAQRPEARGVIGRQPAGQPAPAPPVTSPAPPGSPTGGTAPTPAPAGPPPLPTPAGILPAPSPAANPPATTPSGTTEIIFPPHTVIEAQEKNLLLLDLPLFSKTLWMVPIELPPPAFLVTVGIRARVGLKVELFLRYGPGVLRDIRLALDPSTNRYSGTAQFYLPVAAGPRATLTGSLTGSVDWLGLAEILAIEGGLQAIGQAPLIVALSPSVSVIYDTGSFTFNARPQLDAGFGLTFDLNAYAQARLLGARVWQKTWNLYHWQWGRAVRLGTSLSIDYIGGRLQPVRQEPFAERISIDEMLEGMKTPAEQGSIAVIGPGRRPVNDRLRELLTGPGADPQLILATLADASDAEKAAILGDPTTMDALRGAIGAALWPIADRILNNAPSETAPSLDEGTVFLANRHIRVGRFQDALHVVVSKLQARGFVDGALATFTYARETRSGEGLTTTKYNRDPATGIRTPSGPSAVEIYDPAFVNVPWLFSIIMHEYTHVLQDQRNITTAEWTDPESSDRAEVEAYLWEIEHARGTGVIVSSQQMEEIGRRLTDHFNALSSATQAIYRARYDAAMTRVRDAASGVLPVNVTYSVADARRMVQEASHRIAELVRERAAATPARQAAIDREIETIQGERSEALVEVVLAENPNVEIVDRAKGIYRVPVRDGSGRIEWIYGSILVVWHLQQVSPSVFDLRANIRSRPPAGLPPGTSLTTQLLVGGSGIQGRVQPYPGDIDFGEEFEITAPSAAAAGEAAAATIIDLVSRVSGQPDLEFLYMNIYPPPGSGWATKTWRRDEILDPARRADLARDLADVGNARINTFWRALAEGNRFIEITKIIAIHAISSVTGADIFQTEPSGAEFQEAYLDEAPSQIEPMALGRYAALMRRLALEEAARGHWLKAAKRAFNYLRAIGNLEGMAAVTPIFSTDEARVNRDVAVLEAILSVLRPASPGSRSERSRILRADAARQMIQNAAVIVERFLPTGLTPRLPTDIANSLRDIASRIQGEGGTLSGVVVPDVGQADQLEIDKEEIKSAIDRSLEVRVRSIIDTYVR